MDGWVSGWMCGQVVRLMVRQLDRLNLAPVQNF